MNWFVFILRKSTRITPTNIYRPLLLLTWWNKPAPKNKFEELFFFFFWKAIVKVEIHKHCEIKLVSFQYLHWIHVRVSCSSPKSVNALAGFFSSKIIHYFIESIQFAHILSLQCTWHFICTSYKCCTHFQLCKICNCLPKKKRKWITFFVIDNVIRQKENPVNWRQLNIATMSTSWWSKKKKYIRYCVITQRWRTYTISIQLPYPKNYQEYPLFYSLWFYNKISKCNLWTFILYCICDTELCDISMYSSLLAS